MASLNVDQLQGLLFFFAGGAVLIFVILVVYITTAGRRKKPAFTPSVSSTPPQAIELPEADPVISLLRTRSGGRLQVEVANARYQRLADVKDLEVKRQIVAAAMDLVQFTGVLDGQVPELVPVEKTQTWREDLREDSQVELERARSIPAASNRRPSDAVPDVEARFLSMLSDMGQTPAQPERPSLLDSIQHRLQPKPVEPTRARTFVDDIDDILQRHLQRMPALAGRDLHVRPGPSGTVDFFLDGQQYSSLDDIPNHTARQLIQDAIEEWDETA
jgi:hypothetical protein